MNRTSARNLVCVSLAILVIGLCALGVIARLKGGTEFGQFTSLIEGHSYSIEYPVDWSVKAGQPVKGASYNATTDDFVSADQKATVSVECVSIPQVHTIDDFLQNELNALNTANALTRGFSDVKVQRNGPIVAGTPAPVLDYTFTTGGSTTYSTTVLAFKDCGWLFMYNSTSEGRPYRDLFDRMARSFTPG